MSPPPAAVVFDWGGTLTPWHTVDLLDLWLVAARVLAPDRADELAAALVAAEREFWLRTDAGGHESGTIDDIVDLAAGRLGLTLGASVRKRALAGHLEAWAPHTYTDPEAEPLLRALRERGLRIGLLSNTHWPREWHEQVLARDGVLELFDARVYTSELAHTKPHPQAFHAVLDQLGAEPQRAVMVGDRPRDDITGAKALGMRAVLIPSSEVPGSDVEPDAVAAGLADVLAVVDGWLREG